MIRNTRLIYDNRIGFVPKQSSWLLLLDDLDEPIFKPFISNLLSFIHLIVNRVSFSFSLLLDCKSVYFHLFAPIIIRLLRKVKANLNGLISSAPNSSNESGRDLTLVNMLNLGVVLFTRLFPTSSLFVNASSCLEPLFACSIDCTKTRWLAFVELSLAHNLC